MLAGDSSLIAYFQDRADVGKGQTERLRAAHETQAVNNFRLIETGLRWPTLASR